MDHSEHPGQPQRPPASAYLLIDSLDRYENNQFGADNTNIALLKYMGGASPGADNFTIQRNTPLLNGYFTRLAITQVQFEYNLPTILTDFNDTLYMRYTQGANVNVSVPIVLPAGWYNNTELAAALQATIRAALATAGVPNAGFTCAFTLPNYSLTFETNNTDTFGFADVVTGLNSIQQAQYLKALQLVGITSDQLLAALANPSLTSLAANRSPRLIYTQYVDIVSRNLTKYQRVKDADTASQKNKSYIIARIYFVAPNTTQFVDASGASFGSRPFIICVDYNTPKHIKWSPNEAVHELDFQILDEYGDEFLWDTFYASEFQLTIVASET